MSELYNITVNGIPQIADEDEINEMTESGEYAKPENEHNQDALSLSDVFGDDYE